MDQSITLNSVEVIAERKMKRSFKFKSMEISLDRVVMTGEPCMQ